MSPISSNGLKPTPISPAARKWLDTRSVIPANRRGDECVAPTFGRKDPPEAGGEGTSHNFADIKLSTRQYTGRRLALRGTREHTGRDIVVMSPVGTTKLVLRIP